jgi:hypothetical protein
MKGTKIPGAFKSLFSKKHLQSSHITLLHCDHKSMLCTGKGQICNLEIFSCVIRKYYMSLAYLVNTEGPGFDIR